MRRPKVRELLAALKQAGGRVVRTKGSHQTWELPNGRRLGVVVNHPGDCAGRREFIVVTKALNNDQTRRKP